MGQGYRYQFAEMVLDSRLKVLRRKQEEIPLPWLSYQLLLVLCESAPAIVSQQEIIERVWPDTVVGDEALKQRIKLLRKSLGDDASSPQYIEVIRGRGYRLKPDLITSASISADPNAFLDLTTDSFQLPRSQVVFSNYWKASSMLLAVVLLILFTGSFFKNDASLTPEKFVDEAQPSFEVQLYKKGLIYYQRYRMQDNAHAIKLFNSAINLNPQFALAHAALSGAYSQGVFQFNASNEWKDKAIEHAYQAITIDPDLAEGYKSLSLAYFNKGWFSRAAKASLMAIDKKPTYSEAMSNLGYIYREMGQLVESVKWIERALAIQPDNSVSLVHLAQSYTSLKSFSKAEKLLNKATLLQPDSMMAKNAIGQWLLAQGFNEQAQNHYQVLCKQKSNNYAFHIGLAQSLFMQGKAAELEVLANSMMANSDSKMMHAGQFYHALLDHKTVGFEQAVTRLNLRLAQGIESPKDSWQLSLLHFRSGDTIKAKRYLSQAIHYGFTDLHQLESQAISEKLATSGSIEKLNQELKNRISRQRISLSL